MSVAADHDHWSPAPWPSGHHHELRRRGRSWSAPRLLIFLVIDRIEETDDAALYLNRVGIAISSFSRFRMACEMTVLPFPGGP